MEALPTECLKLDEVLLLSGWVLAVDADRKLL